MITKKIYIKNSEELEELIQKKDIPEDFREVIEKQLAGLIGNRYVCLEISSYFTVKNVEAEKVPMEERQKTAKIDSSYYL